MRFCFDLDSTLVTQPLVQGDYSTVAPIDRNIQFCRFLKDQGHYIIIYTARRMKTHQGNVGAVLRDIGQITQDTLTKYNIPYDELHFGKPYAHFYIDDLAVSAHLNLEKELGFYQTQIKERDFHKLNIKDTHIIKSGKKGKSLDGEIHWYRNIPSSVVKYFPKLLHYQNDYSEFVIEKINGITLSNLYVNESLSDKLLIKLITCIQEIHESLDQPLITSEIKDKDIDIYSNYSDKIKDRYQTYDYSRFENSGEVYYQLLCRLDDYKSKHHGCVKVIHGDPVFTNVMVNQNFDLKFIDMRGKQGDKLTILGDKFYDYAKIYQSLIGYDFILLDKTINKSYQNHLLKIFESYFTDEEMDTIKLITASLIFSLIPLHDNDKCTEYYSLIEEYNLFNN